MSFLLNPARTSAACRTPSSSLTSAFSRSFSSTPRPALARLTLVGRLGTDPEQSETSSGAHMVKYVLGTSSGPKDNRQTSWFRVTSFQTPESKLTGYLMGLQKGTLVYFEGDATMKTYDDADGKKQSALNLIQTKIEVLKRPTPKEDGGVEDGM